MCGSTNGVPRREHDLFHNITVHIAPKILIVQRNMGIAASRVSAVKSSATGLARRGVLEFGLGGTADLDGGP